MCHPIFLLWKNEQSTVLFIGAIWTKTFKSNFPTDSVYKLFRLDYYFKKIHHVTNRLVKRYLQFSARYQFQRTSSSGPLKILHVPTYMYLPTCTYLHVPTYMYLPTCTYLHELWQRWKKGALLTTGSMWTYSKARFNHDLLTYHPRYLFEFVILF